MAGMLARLGGCFSGSEKHPDRRARDSVRPFGTFWPLDGEKSAMEEPGAKVHSADLTERTGALTRSSWHSCVGFNGGAGELKNGG